MKCDLHFYKIRFLIETITNSDFNIKTGDIKCYLVELHSGLDLNSYCNCKKIEVSKFLC